MFRPKSIYAIITATWYGVMLGYYSYYISIKDNTYTCWGTKASDGFWSSSDWWFNGQKASKIGVMTVQD